MIYITAYDELYPIIAEIDGVPLSFAEYKQSISAKRAAVMSKYVSYGIETERGFWETEYKGKTPFEKLKQVAFDEAVRRKIIQIFARQKGITCEITYKAFLQKHEAENNRRAGNQIIYGPKQYETAVFFDLYIAELSAETTTNDENNKALAEMIQKANIKINHEVYDNISVDDVK